MLDPMPNSMGCSTVSHLTISCRLTRRKSNLTRSPPYPLGWMNIRLPQGDRSSRGRQWALSFHAIETENERCAACDIHSERQRSNGGRFRPCFSLKVCEYILNNN